MAKIIVFKDSNFNGDALVLTVNDPNLKPQGFGDEISSLIVTSGQWTLYKDENYGGTSWTVSQNGGPTADGVYPDWGDWGGENDAISSIKIT
jgi:hypothetical protein